MPWTATFHYGLALCFYVAALRAKKSWRSLLLLAVRLLERHRCRSQRVSLLVAGIGGAVSLRSRSGSTVELNGLKCRKDTGVQSSGIAKMSDLLHSNDSNPSSPREQYIQKLIKFKKSKVWLRNEIRKYDLKIRRQAVIAKPTDCGKSRRNGE